MAELKSRTPKAYHAQEKDASYSTIVFAENPTKAKLAALASDCCDGADYIDIRVSRMPKADSLYKGRSEVDWDDQETRVALVRDFGWSCLETSWECDTCEAKPYCHWHEGDGGEEDAPD